MFRKHFHAKIPEGCCRIAAAVILFLIAFAAGLVLI